MGSSRILALRKPLVRFHAQEAGWALFLSLTAAAAYLTAFFGAAYAGPLWLRLAAAVAAGPLIALLFRIAHDAGHGSHFADARLDRLVCQLSLLPSYHPHSVWILLHNGRHHSFTNLRDNDYIWIPKSKAEYDALGCFGRLKERAYRTTLGVGFYYLCSISLRMIAVRPSLVRKVKPAYLRDALVSLSFLLAQLVLLALDRPDPGTFLSRVALAIVLPILIFNWLVGFASFLNHTHPRVPWFARREDWSFYQGQVHCTVHVGVPPWMIFFLTDLGLHGAHHIDPRIPIWQLEPAEERIVAAAGEDIVFEPWTFARHREIMRACKLYDYDNHRWLDFAGRPTTPVIEMPRFP
ncbi:fatty acid desaturase [Microbacteriaceae bacterium K1510]|nr:fatty acid desaturase [Microbacteriaceae bacterium K1510]